MNYRDSKTVRERRVITEFYGPQIGDDDGGNVWVVLAGLPMRDRRAGLAAMRQAIIGGKPGNGYTVGDVRRVRDRIMNLQSQTATGRTVGGYDSPEPNGVGDNSDDVESEDNDDDDVGEDDMDEVYDVSDVIDDGYDDGGYDDDDDGLVVL